jgi:hypothetical protein
VNDDHELDDDLTARAYCDTETNHAITETGRCFCGARPLTVVSD